jgi:endonuclease/exonuclease/phosphatase family metal-dependent hydrolase
VREGQRDPYRNVAQLAGLEPDIVLMQEFGPGRGTNMQQAVRDAAAFRDFQLSGGRQAILSRWPVEELSDNPLAGELGSAWRVRVAPGLSLVCLDVHLSAPTLKTQLLRGWSWSELRHAVKRTRQELKELGEALTYYARQGPVVLAGDFNLPPSYPDLRRARGRLVDCFARGGYGWGKTAPARLPAMRPDQVYVPPGSRVYYAAAVPTRWSDHYMTLAEVAVTLTAGPSPDKSGPPVDRLRDERLPERGVPR